MQTHEFFLLLLTVLLSARVLAEFAIRLGIPPVIGELLAGVILGPSLLGWIEPAESLRLLAEIGIILLLFQVGLETDLHRLAHHGRKSAWVALAGFVLPFSLGFAVSHYLFGTNTLTALFIGGTLTATSIGITVRVLSDLQRRNAIEGQIVLGAAVLDDLLGVVLLAILYKFAQGEGFQWAATGKVILFISAFFVVAPVLAKVLATLIRHFEALPHVHGLIPTTIIGLVLFLAWLAHVSGAPELLGGFAAGLALSRRFFLPFGAALHTDEHFATRIEQQMHPIVYLFTPIFFVMVGLSLNLHEVDWQSGFIWTFSLALFLVAVIGKFAGALLLRENWQTRILTGVAMAPRGEVGLIFAELGRISGILNNEIYAALLIVIALTTLLAPFAMKGLYSYFRISGPELQG